MTIEELIEELSAKPMDMLVAIDLDGGEHDIFSVKVVEEDESHQAAVILYAE